MANSGDDFVNSLKDTFNGKGAKDTISQAMDRAKSYLGIKGTPPPQPAPPPPPVDDRVEFANESFRKAAEADKAEAAAKAAKVAQKPAPKAKPTPRYKDGTDYVPETGPAILHKGEAVLKKEDADKYRRQMSSPEKSLSKGKKPSKKSSKKPKHKIRSTHIEHGEDGSHVIRHSYEQPDMSQESAQPMQAVPDSVHGVSDSDGLLSHMQGQFGGQLPPQGGGEMAAAGPAAGGAPAAGGGM